MILFKKLPRGYRKKNIVPHNMQSEEIKPLEIQARDWKEKQPLGLQSLDVAPKIELRGP